MSAELDQRVAKLEEFAADVRAFTRILTEMMRRHDERLDDHDASFRNADEKIAALADAQIKSEVNLGELRVEAANADGKIAALADAQIKTEDALRRQSGSLDELRSASANADARIAALADAQIKTEDALRELASIVSRHAADGHGG